MEVASKAGWPRRTQEVDPLGSQYDLVRVSRGFGARVGTEWNPPTSVFRAAEGDRIGLGKGHLDYVRLRPRGARASVFSKREHREVGGTNLPGYG